MDFLTRALLSLLFVLCLSPPQSVSAYDPPDFSEAFFDRDALLLDQAMVDSLVEALNSIACNFPDSSLIDDDLIERALALALSLDPLSVNARSAHDVLSRGGQPGRTAYFTDSVTSVSERLWSMASEISRGSVEPEVRKLALFLQEISLLLHPAPPETRVKAYESLTEGTSQPWDKLVKLQPADNPSSRKLEMLFENKPAPAKSPTLPPATPKPAPGKQPAPPLTLTPPPGAPVQHLIYLCDFENSVGTADLSPRKNHGKANGVVSGPGRSAASRKSLHFRSKEDNLILPIDISPMEIPDLSICMWAKNDGEPKRYGLLLSHFDRQGLDRSIMLERRPDRPWMWGIFKGADGPLLNPKFAMKADKWTFLAVTYSHSSLVIKFYVDDQMVETKGACGKGLPELFVGNNSRDPGKEFKGWIDDLCIFNRVLEPDEVKQIRNGSLFTKLINESASLPSSALRPHRIPLPPPSYGGKSLSEDLIYACNFEESDGSIDQSPEKNHGIAVGIERVPGVGGNSSGIKIDSIKDRLACSANIRPFIHSELTISGWFKPEEPENNLAVVFSPGAGGQRGFQIFKSKAHNDQFMWGFSCGGGGRLTTGRTEFGKWAHIAAAYDHPRTQARFYINGKEYRSDNAACGVGRDYFSIGRSPAFGNQWRGCVDNLLVYSRALSPDEIRTLYRTTGASSRFSPSNKITQSGGRTSVLPSWISNHFPGPDTRGIHVAKFHVIGTDRLKAELNLEFNLQTLAPKASSFRSCHLVAKVAQIDHAETGSTVTLMNDRGKIGELAKADAGKEIRFELPVQSIDFSQVLKLKLQCGNDELMLEKNEPHAVKLVLQ